MIFWIHVNLACFWNSRELFDDRGSWNISREFHANFKFHAIFTWFLKKRTRFTWIQISREIHVNRKNTLNSREIFLGNAWFWFHVQTEKALRIRHDFPVLGESFREVLLGDWGSYGSSFHYN